MKKFKKIFQSVLTELGLIDKAKAQNLSDEDWDCTVLQRQDWQ